MARDYTDKIVPQAAAFLPNDEVVQQAVVANVTGGGMDHLNMGEIDLHRLRQKQRRTVGAIEGGGGVAAQIPTCNAYLTVTNKRLVLFDLNWKGKLKSIIGAFEGSELEELVCERRDKNTADVHIFFADGSHRAYAVIQKQDAEGFVERVNQLL